MGTSLCDSAQTTLDATTGNISSPGVSVDASNGRAYYVVTFYDGEQIQDTAAIGALPVHFGDNQRPVLLGAYSTVHRDTRAVAVERSRMARVAHVLMQTEGRDLGSFASALDAALGHDLRTQHVRFRFVEPLALAVVGGLTSSTLLSLFLVPAVIVLLAKSPAPSEVAVPLTQRDPPNPLELPSLDLQFPPRHGDAGRPR